MNTRLDNGSGLTPPSSDTIKDYLARVERWIFGSAGCAKKDRLIGMAVVFALSLLLIHYYRGVVPAYNAGEIATEDVKAPSDLTVIDPREAEAVRQIAKSEVKPVYDYDPTVLSAKIDRLKVDFTAARAVLDDVELSHQEVKLDQLQSSVERRTSWQFTESQFKTLYKYRFNPELEELAIKNLQTVMAGGILNNRETLKQPFTGITVRDQENNAETAITDISAIRDFFAARAWLRSNAALWPSSYDQHDRTDLGEWVGSLILPSLTYDKVETEKRQQFALAKEPEPKHFAKGEPIVRRGQTVTPMMASALSESRSRFKFRDNILEFLGSLLVVASMMIAVWRFLARHYKVKQMKPRPLFLLLAILFGLTLILSQLFGILAVVMNRNITVVPFGSQIAYEYLTPFAVGAALVVLLTDVGLAFVFSAVLSVFIGLLSGNVYIAAYTLLSSLAAIHFLKHIRSRGAILRDGVYLGLLNMLVVAALDLLGANMVRLNSIGFDMVAAMVSVVFTAVVALVTLPIFEVTFKVTTDIKLIELGNLDLPILRRLASEAPGTYHHSIVVGMLAEAAAEAIGADALFARVASYYHDIGKIKMPEYFAENFSYLADKHETLKPKISSIVIANHVREGLDIARREKVPPRIQAIIGQHHGTALMSHFYNKAMQSTEPRFADVMENEFRYNGPKPQSREAAIIMIADAIEVASRSVTEPNPTRLQGLINDIIKAFRDDDLFEQCELTMGELHTIGESFLRILSGIHYHRVSQGSGQDSSYGWSGSAVNSA